MDKKEFLKQYQVTLNRDSAKAKEPTTPNKNTNYKKAAAIAGGVASLTAAGYCIKKLKNKQSSKKEKEEVMKEATSLLIISETIDLIELDELIECMTDFESEYNTNYLSEEILSLYEDNVVGRIKQRVKDKRLLKKINKEVIGIAVDTERDTYDRNKSYAEYLKNKVHQSARDHEYAKNKNKRKAIGAAAGVGAAALALHIRNKNKKRKEEQDRALKEGIEYLEYYVENDDVIDKDIDILIEAISYEFLSEQDNLQKSIKKGEKQAEKINKLISKAKRKVDKNWDKYYKQKRIKQELHRKADSAKTIGKTALATGAAVYASGVLASKLNDLRKKKKEQKNNKDKEIKENYIMYYDDYFNEEGELAKAKRKAAIGVGAAIGSTATAYGVTRLVKKLKNKKNQSTEEKDEVVAEAYDFMMDLYDDETLDETTLSVYIDSIADALDESYEENIDYVLSLTEADYNFGNMNLIGGMYAGHKMNGRPTIHGIKRKNSNSRQTYMDRLRNASSKDYADKIKGSEKRASELKDKVHQAAVNRDRASKLKDAVHTAANNADVDRTLRKRRKAAAIVAGGAAAAGIAYGATKLAKKLKAKKNASKEEKEETINEAYDYIEYCLENYIEDDLIELVETVEELEEDLILSESFENLINDFNNYLY